MQGFRRDPYLWVHLSGLAAVPLAMGLCLLSLAVEKTFLPGPLQYLAIAVIGIGPVLWMQLQRPFSIFSLLAAALKPEALSEDQRRILGWFRTPLSQAVAIATALLMLVLFTQLVRLAPSLSSLTPLNGVSPFNVLLLAAGSFLAANLFAQVPAAVLRVILLSPARFEAGAPYPTDSIRQDFTLLGLRLSRILPDLETGVASSEAAAIATSSPEEAAAPATEPVVAEPEPQPEATGAAAEATPEPEAPQTTAQESAPNGETQLLAVEPQAPELIYVETPVATSEAEAIPTDAPTDAPAPEPSDA